MPKKDVSTLITEANEKLKEAKIGFQIQRRGDRLVLQGTLPPRPGSAKTEWHQQRISLGFRANPAGVKAAKKKAETISGQLAFNEFNWEDYLNVPKVKPATCKEWVDRFETDYFQKRSRTPKSETTWKTSYLMIFEKLPQERTISPQVLLDTVLQIPPDTRTRQKACIALDRLAQFAGIEADLKAYKGNYSPKRVQPRNLPDDETIARWFYKIPNPQWQWVYGMMACYGLRNHEVFHLEPLEQETPILLVTGGKTGERLVWPCYPEWVDQWDLRNYNPPNVTGRTNADLGNRVTVALRRYKIPFPPYDLRHCWARRTIDFGLDVSLAAQQMGHSVQVHTDLYHAWIGEATHQRAYNIIMARGDRPQPPQID